MIKVRDFLGRARPLAVAVGFASVAVLSVLPAHIASAEFGAVTDRSLQVSSTSVSGDAENGAGTDVSGTAGHPNNGDRVWHTYTFTPSKTNTIRAITFEVCDNAFGYAGTCTVPSGFDVSATLGTDTVTVAQGATTEEFSATRTSSGVWELTSAAGLTVGSLAPITVTFTGDHNYFQNPDATYAAGAQQGTYFVHLQTWNHESGRVADGTNDIDEGTVTNSVVTQIEINARVQETLKFSVEGDMREDASNPGSRTNLSDPRSGTLTESPLLGPTSVGAGCDPLTGLGTILIGDLANNALATSTQYEGYSYFRLATNSANGANVYYAGDTLRSGGNDIDPLTTLTAAATQSEQFGLNIDTANSTLTQLTPIGDYADIANGYLFEATPAGTPVPIASSTGVVTCDTGTIEYIANIAEDTPAGIYTTKLSYIATPSY